MFSLSAIRRRSAAMLFAVVIAANTWVTARAQDSDLTGDQVLSRAGAAERIAGYSVPVHFDVHLLRPVRAKGGVEGVATFTAPARSALAITHAPGLIGIFFRGTYTIDIVPQAWPAKYHVSSVAIGDYNGAKVYVLQAQPMPATAAIDGVTFQIAQADFAPLTAQWAYHNGSSIKLAFANQRVGNLTLPLAATISVAMPQYALDAAVRYGNYAVTERH